MRSTAEPMWLVPASCHPPRRPSRGAVNRGWPGALLAGVVPVVSLVVGPPSFGPRFPGPKPTRRRTTSHGRAACTGATFYEAGRPRGRDVGASRWAQA